MKQITFSENRKSAVRCKVEHAFKIIKDTFSFRKVRSKKADCDCERISAPLCG